MFGCAEAAIALASFRNRDSARSSKDSRSARILRATSRSSLASHARFTSPMLPDPINDTIEYGPSRVCGGKGIKRDRKRGGGGEGGGEGWRRVALENNT